MERLNSCGGGVEKCDFEKEMGLIIDYTINAEEAQLSKIEFTQEKYPLLKDLKTIWFSLIKPNNATDDNRWMQVVCGNVLAINFGSTPKSCVGIAMAKNGYWLNGTFFNSNPNLIAEAKIGLAFNHSNMNDIKINKKWEPFNQITIQSYGKFLQEGTRIRIWGDVL